MELLIGMDNARWLSETVRDHKLPGKADEIVAFRLWQQIHRDRQLDPAGTQGASSMMHEDDYVMEEVPNHEEKGVKRGERHPPQPFPPVGHPKNKTNTGAAPFQQGAYNRTSRLGGKQENSLASMNQVLAKLALLVIGLSGAHRLNPLTTTGQYTYT